MSDTPALDAAAREARRDPRLDFFRGIGMFIILIAHIPWNTWTNWIPARYGFSDATEIFVFCSGAASAIAFLKVFDRHGWGIGTARVGYRIWQIYWCHVGLFFAIAVTLLLVDGWLANDGFYLARLNLPPFFNDPKSQLVGLMTLTYVPNYFDILVMYMVILALMPVVVALGRRNVRAALGFVVLLWLVTQFAMWDYYADRWWNDAEKAAFARMNDLTLGIGSRFSWLNLPAEPWSTRTWFFNPFGWQLIFFTGFAFSVGWLPRPPFHWGLIVLALVIVIGSMPFAWGKLFGRADYLGIASWAIAGRVEMAPFWYKTGFGLFRYLHFLALAYLAWLAAGEGGRRLPLKGLAGGVVTVVRRVGQQSLAVFIVSMLLARLLGVFIYEMGKPPWAVVTANLVGFALIIGVAYGARWFRNPPWSRR